jgi:peptidoglycan hydrolase-like protein with peptidoglycan-binding domain
MNLTMLSQLSDPVPLETLSDPTIAELQTALSMLGYPVGDSDGMVGPKTRTAWAEFKTDVFQGNPDMIGPGAVAALQAKLTSLGATTYDFSTKQGTIEAIKSGCKQHGIGLPVQIAYVLATTEWETAKTFKPVREAFWKDEQWRKDNLRYYPYYGRGFVQLTWKNNYETYAKLLGVDIVNDPDKALIAQDALFVLCHGFNVGTFTGRKITDYLTAVKKDFIGARRCINGTDHAVDIAALAEGYLAGLTATYSVVNN